MLIDHGYNGLGHVGLDRTDAKNCAAVAVFQFASFLDTLVMGRKISCVIFFKGGIALRCSAQDAEPMPMRNAAADLTRDARSLRRAAAPGDPW